MYGIILSAAILTCLLVGEKLAKIEKLKVSLYWSTMQWTIISGLIGARLYHVIDFWAHYSANPISILYIHQGGLGIYGALFGGVAGLYFSLKKQGSTNFIHWLDLSAVVVPLGQAIGRWGNFANRELFGLPTNLPWGLFIPPANRPEQYMFNDSFHPLFLYESLLVISMFLALLSIYLGKGVLGRIKIRSKPLSSIPGFLTMTYILGYGFIRGGLDFLRIDPWTIYGINISQLISLIFILIGILGIYKLAKKG